MISIKRTCIFLSFLMIFVLYLYLAFRKAFDINEESKKSKEIKFLPRQRFVKYHGIGKPFLPNQSVTLAVMTPYFNSWEFWTEAFIDFTTSNCKYKCRFMDVTEDRYKADVLIYHANDLHKQFILPKRDPNQIWLVYSEESPWNVEVHMSDYNKLFNWTCFVRSDSDVLMTHGRTESINPNEAPDIGDIQPRLKFAYWMALNCEAFTERDIYIHELKQYIEVDVYGHCLPDAMKCPKYGENAMCDGKNYNFHLAFEDAVCRDYISEKFWRSLDVGAIPVVLGDSPRYKKLAPPNSYIDVADFASPKDLADHLLNVQTNLTLYQSYFAWKKHHKEIVFSPKNFPCTGCELCEALHKWDGGRQVYTDLSGWHNEDYCPTYTYWNRLRDMFTYVSGYSRVIRRYVLA